MSKPKQITDIDMDGIIADSSNFYHAYKILKEKQNELKCLQTFDNYDKNYKTIKNYTIPHIVCGAFCIELCLKYLLYKKKGFIPPLHYLNELLQELDDNSLIDLLCAKLEINDRQVYKIFKDYSNLFCDARYFFEKKQPCIGTPIEFENIIDVLYDYTINKE